MSLLTNLLAWWGLHDAAGSSRLDSSGNGNTLALTGSVGSVAGLLGNAASFGGQGNLLSAAGVLITAAPFSMVCWINATSLANSPIAMAQSIGVGIRQGFGISSAGAVTFNSGFGPGGRITTGNGLVGTGAWCHLALTHDGTTLKGYVNGVLQGSAAKSFQVGTSALTVGDLGPGSSTAFFSGLAELAGAWSRTLTDGGVSVSQTAGGEVAQLYNGGAGLDYPFTLPDFLRFRNEAVYVPGGVAGQEWCVGGKRGQVFIEGGTAGDVSI